LQKLYATALDQIAQGRYGQQANPAGAVVITTRRRAYTVGDLLAEGDLANVYTCEIAEGRQRSAGLLKIARDPEDYDLLLNEARTLRHLLAPIGTDPVPAYVPRLLDSFFYRDASGAERRVNAFPLVTTERGPLPADELFSVAEIRQAYPNGVDPKQMAWMWRRLLIALGHAHDREVIHGAVLPPHILIHPEAHGLLLVDWCASVQRADTSGDRIAAISTDYERWYPPSVLAGRPPTPAVDLEMGLRSMVYLLGGDPLTGALPPHVPGPLQAYLHGALASGAAGTSAWRLYQDFSDLLASLWGQRSFVPFSMPARRRDGPTG
jgi:hypothetical protein